MSKTNRREKLEPPEEFRPASVNEERGIDDWMPRTQHLLDRIIRHMPFEDTGDSRDYGRAQARRDTSRRRRQVAKAICREYPLDPVDPKSTK